MGNFKKDNKQGSRSSFGGGSFGRRSFRDGGRKRNMHQAVCSQCGKDCEVPFEPTGNKPVYCSNCFEKHGGGGDSRRFHDRGPRRQNFDNDNSQLESINRKLDKILDMLSETQGSQVE